MVFRKRNLFEYKLFPNSKAYSKFFVQLSYKNNKNKNSAIEQHWLFLTFKQKYEQNTILNLQYHAVRLKNTKFLVLEYLAKGNIVYQTMNLYLN